MSYARSNCRGAIRRRRCPDNGRLPEETPGTLGRHYFPMVIILDTHRQYQHQGIRLEGTCKFIFVPHTVKIMVTKFYSYHTMHTHTSKYIINKHSYRLMATCGAEGYFCLCHFLSAQRPSRGILNLTNCDAGRSIAHNDISLAACPFHGQA
jgi:hypothetical protein